MKSEILDLWIRIHASYWFIPSLMAAAAIVLANGVVYLDARIGSEWLYDYQWIHANRPAGARALLSTVAGSMITVAGVTFSMTLLAVSHASAQFGPRLLTGFMRDRGNQFTLGTFIATFLYCLMVLRTVHTGIDGAEQGAGAAFVPHLAIIVAVGLAMLSVAVLIYFIHHVPQSISVSTVISRVGDELVHGIQCMYPTRIGDGAPAGSSAKTLPDGFHAGSRLILATGDAGYLRVLDADSLLDLASEHDLVVGILRRPGDFVVDGQPLMQVWPAEHCDDSVRDALCAVCSWGRERTREQDVMFPAEQLVEVLGKAMSPGVNGQYTAMICINQFERAFVELLQRSEPKSHRVDEDGKLRVIAEPVSHHAFFAGVMGPIRQFVRGDWVTTDALLKSLRRLRSMPQLDLAAPLLSSEIDRIEQDIATSSMTAFEKNLLIDQTTPADVGGLTRRAGSDDD